LRDRREHAADEAVRVRRVRLRHDDAARPLVQHHVAAGQPEKSVAHERQRGAVAPPEVLGPGGQTEREAARPREHVRVEAVHLGDVDGRHDAACDGTSQALADVDPRRDRAEEDFATPRHRGSAGRSV